jgi:hypothetical protein
MLSIFLLVALSSSILAAEFSAPEDQVPNDYTKVAFHVADFLLSLQNESGAIADTPGSTLANEDSNMEYALAGLAAAYWYSKDRRYLRALENGISWLADRQEMADPQWRGSWFYAYRTTPPYAPVAISPGK